MCGSRYLIIFSIFILFGENLYPMERSEEGVSSAEDVQEVVDVVPTTGGQLDVTAPTGGQLEVVEAQGFVSREDGRNITNILMPVMIMGMSGLRIAEREEERHGSGRPVAKGSEVVIEFESSIIQRTHDLKSYYNPETKTLDLSRLPIKRCDETLKRLFFGSDETPNGKLFHFLESVPVENLILEQMGLKEIPAYIITYALASQTLQYVSLKYNEFNLPGVPTSSLHSHRPSDSSRFVAPSVASTSADTKPTLTVPEVTTKPRSGSAGAAMAAAQFTSAFLQDLIPKMVDQAIKIQGAEGAQIKIFKKIIEIHENLPPITIVDQRVLSDVQPQPGKRAQVMTICRDVTIGVLSLAAGLIPFVISYLMQEDTCSC